MYLLSFLKYIYRGQSFASPKAVSCVASDQNMSATIQQGSSQPGSGGEFCNWLCALMKNSDVKNSPCTPISWVLWGGCQCNTYGSVKCMMNPRINNLFANHSNEGTMIEVLNQICCQAGLCRMVGEGCRNHYRCTFPPSIIV